MPYPSRRYGSTIEYDVSTSIGYGVSTSLSNTAYSSQQVVHDKDPDELRSSYFNLLSDEEYSEEEEDKEMAETMEWLRNEQTCSIKTWEDLKTKFLNKYCPPGQTAKKIEEINNFQQEPDETLYLAWERFKELLMKCPQHYLTKMQEVILFYNDAKTAIQEIAEYSQKWHNGTSRGRNTETTDGLAVIQAQLNNPGREIKKVNEKVYAAQVGCEQCNGPHYTKDCL
ncbi:hypothetical protein Tco_1575699 [Tanacetum coccineum]